MPLSAQQKHEAELPELKLQAIPGSAAGEAPVSTDWKPQLTEALQSTLDVEVLLGIYLTRINTLIPVEGIHFINTELPGDIQLKRQASHSCGYRLMLQNQQLGEIVFKRDNKFREAELETLEQTLAVLVKPLRNAIKYELAVNTALTDPLTGAANHLAMTQLLARETELAKRHNQHLSIIMIELRCQHSKTVSLQSETEDRLLQGFAENALKLCRETDVIFRSGGDQLLILLHQSDAREAAILMDQLSNMHTYRNRSLSSEEKDYRLLAGAATLTGTDSVNSFIDRAYRNMEQA